MYGSVLEFVLLASLLGVIQSKWGSKTVVLRGGGATLPAPLYNAWISTYEVIRGPHIHLEITYDSIGSGRGKARIKSGRDDEGRTVIYAGSDSHLSVEDYRDYPDLQMIPILAGAVVISYNLPTLVKPLILSREQLLAIYNGTITMWNDSSLKATNPDAELPNRKIIVIARGDKSGSTEVMTTVFSAVSPDWRAKYGTFNDGVDSDGEPIHWNASVVDYYAYKIRGVSGLILSFRYSLGYVSLLEAKDAELNYACLINKAGHVVPPHGENVQSAMDDYAGSFSKHFTVDLTDGPGNLSYPLATYTYLIIYKRGMEDCDQAVELLRYINWTLNDARASRICFELNLVGLSKTVAKRIEDGVLKHLTCGEKGLNVHDLAETRRREEEAVSESLSITLYIIITLICAGLVIFSTTFLSHCLVTHRRVLRGEWRIQIDTGVLNCRSGMTNASISLSTVGTNRRSFNADGQMHIASWEDHKLMLKPAPDYLQGNIKFETAKAILWMKDSIHNGNVCAFYGLTLVENKYQYAREWYRKGALQDIIMDDRFNLDINFKYSMTIDVCQGMAFLEKKGIVHGYLTSRCCYMDGRWTVKIGDWEVSRLQKCQVCERLLHDETDEHFSHLWTAPEVIRSKQSLTGKSDVYSFAIIVYEIFTRTQPYDELLDDIHPREIVRRVEKCNLRPKFGTQVHVPVKLRELLQTLWLPAPEQRQDFARTLKMLSRTRKTNKSVLDCMMDAMTTYMTTLEDRVAERTLELEAAMTKVKTVLYQILPPPVAEKLSNGESVQPEYYDSVSIFFSDVVGFTAMSSQSTPLQIVNFLNSLYTTFDSIIDKHEVYKVETIGDAYMVVSGLPKEIGKMHVKHIANMALEFMRVARELRIPHLPSKSVRLRAGFHSGPVTAGVVGVKMPRYCVFGDAVNVASRMESTSEAMKIQLSSSSQSLLDELGGFLTQPRGAIEVKGKGSMNTYWLLDPEEIEIPSA